MPEQIQVNSFKDHTKALSVENGPQFREMVGALSYLSLTPGGAEAGGSHVWGQNRSNSKTHFRRLGS